MRFDRFLLPQAALRQSIRVTPGLLDAETGDPKAGVFFFEPAWDPTERLLSFRLPNGGRWLPETLHSVTLNPPSDEGDIGGIRAIDGTPLPEPYAFGFVSGASVSDPNNDGDDTWPTMDFCHGREAPWPLPSVATVLESACGQSNCHGGDQPTMGLDLSTSEGLRGSALRISARQTLVGPTVGAPQANPSRFGDNMARIEPGSPGSSYLMYKLLINEASYDEPDPSAWDPWVGPLGTAGAPSVEEITRLREGIVQGEPMPIGGRLNRDELRAVMTWIGLGAVVNDCPAP